MNYPIPKSNSAYERSTMRRSTVASRGDMDFSQPFDIDNAPYERSELMRVVFMTDLSDTEYKTHAGRLPWDAEPDVVLRHALAHLWRDGQEPLAYMSVRLEYDPATRCEAWIALVWCLPFVGVRAVGRADLVEPKLYLTNGMFDAAEDAYDENMTDPFEYSNSTALRAALTAALKAHRPY
jgi:hypothetical protein